MTLSKLERARKAHHALTQIYKLARPNRLSFELATVQREVSTLRVLLKVRAWQVELTKAWGTSRSFIPSINLVLSLAMREHPISQERIVLYLRDLFVSRAKDVSAKLVTDQLAFEAQFAGRWALEALGLIEKQVTQPFFWESPADVFAEEFAVLDAEVEARIGDALKRSASQNATFIANAADPRNPSSKLAGGDFTLGLTAAQQPSRRTIREIAAGLQRTSLDLSSADAMRIARTETARVYGAVSRETYRRNGIQSIRWLTSGGDKVDPTRHLQPLHPNQGSSQLLL